MGKIKKILEKELGSNKSVEVYPVTSIEAVYDENNERLDNIINRKNKEIQKELEAEVTRASNAESNLRETINNITEINENATSANIVTIDTIPNTSSSNAQQALNELFKNATFAGIATPTTDPGTPNGPVFYIANQEGTYTNFNGIKLSLGDSSILKYSNGAWEKILLFELVNNLTTDDVTKALSAKMGKELAKGIFFRNTNVSFDTTNIIPSSPTSTITIGDNGEFIVKLTSNGLVSLNFADVPNGLYLFQLGYSYEYDMSLYTEGNDFMHKLPASSEGAFEFVFEKKEDVNSIVLSCGYFNNGDRFFTINHASIKSFGTSVADVFKLSDNILFDEKNSKEEWFDIEAVWKSGFYTLVKGEHMPAITTHQTRKCIVIDVKEGERYKYSVAVNGSETYIALVDEDNIVIDTCNDTYRASFVDRQITIPNGCTKMVLQTTSIFDVKKASASLASKYVANKELCANYQWAEPALRFDPNSMNLGNIGEVASMTSISSHYRGLKVKCKEGDLFKIRTRVGPTYAYAFVDKEGIVIESFPYYNVKVAEKVTSVDGYVIAPPNSEYLCVNCSTGSTLASHAGTTLFNGLCMRVHLKKEPVINNNSEAINAIYSSMKLATYNKAYQKNCLTIAHISDTHNDIPRYNNFITFIESHSSIIDVAIHTGDLVVGAEGVVTEIKKHLSCEKEKEVIKVVGNHERGGHDDSSVITGNAVYEALEQVTDTGKLYFYKDVKDVRFIILDMYDYDSNDHSLVMNTHYSQEQINWFIDTLKSAKSSNKKVIVAMHAIEKNIMPTPNDKGFYADWLSYEKEVSYFDGTPIFDIIDAFQRGDSINKSYSWSDGSNISLSVSTSFSGSGIFIAYLVGHLHKDAIGYNSKYPNQLILGVNIGCAIPDYGYSFDSSRYGEGVSDLARELGTKMEDCFNFYSIDTANRKVRVVRIGADITMDMKERKYAEFSF